MRVLRLADQQTPAMDKLHYYVLQTDRMLEMYVADAEERGVGLLTSATIRAMDCSRSAHLSDDSMSDFEDFEEMKVMMVMMMMMMTIVMMMTA